MLYEVKGKRVEEGLMKQGIYSDKVHLEVIRSLLVANLALLFVLGVAMLVAMVFTVFFTHYPSDPLELVAFWDHVPFVFIGLLIGAFVLEYGFKRIYGKDYNAATARIKELELSLNIAMRHND